MKGNLTAILIPWMLVTAAACGVEEIDPQGPLDPQETLDFTTQAISGSAFGFAKSTQLIGTSTPDPDYSGSSSGKPITVQNISTGHYLVTFQGLGGEGGNAQVVALGTDNTRCQVETWGTTTDGSEQIFVSCNTPTGTLINSKFVVRYVRASSGSKPSAYLFASVPWNFQYPYSYVPGYSFNSTGNLNLIEIWGTGMYVVHLFGLGGMNGNVLVTAVGTSGEHCNVSNWSSEPGDRPVVVRCWSATGAPTPAQFLLAFDGANTTGFNNVGAFAWANDSTSASYTPSFAYNYNSGDSACSGGVNTAGRLGTGSYFMRYPSMPLLDSTVHVTARSYPDAPSYCKLESWGVGTSGYVEIQTRCFDSSGAAKDSQYLESYYTTDFIIPC